jgi:type VI secretion system protein VasG
MSDISRAALFGKLNSLSYKAVEGATVFCKLRGNPYVELVHWLHQVLQLQTSDVHCIVRALDLNGARLAEDLTIALDRLPRGATAISDLSPHLIDAVERAWVWATLKYQAARIRSAHVLLALLKTPTLRGLLSGISREFDKIKPDELADHLERITASSPEADLAASDAAGLSAGAEPGEASGALAPAQLGKQEALKKFTVDLTEQARLGKIDPVVGRDDEIRQIVDILMRRRQNNPILTGEAGVGKTAVVEGFARRIAAGEVPPALKDVSLLMLDVGLLQAGASMKGEFEQRLRQVIDEVHASARPIVLFIDEVHTLVGAGGAAGTGDAANLLKPALARGTLRTIGATTWGEYKKHIEKDPALTRRFQTVKVEEPEEERALLMLRGIVSAMEKHHRVQVLDAALESAVKLSHRYIADRQLPDKAVSLLDTACARVAVSHHARPPEVEDCQRRIEGLETERQIIEREAAIGLDVTDRARRVEEALEGERTRLAGLNEAWSREKALVDEILALRGKLRETVGSVDGPAAREPARSVGGWGAGEAAGSVGGLGSGNSARSRDVLELAEPARLEARVRLAELQARLAAERGEQPLVLPDVDEQAVATVVADWTGIPVGRMVKDEVATVLKLADILGQRVVGQDHALAMIAQRVQTARAGLENPSKPIGVFLLAGPSGVGKTETALALAEAMYGGEQNLITINMSEFQEAHTVSTLKGAPPGYVGYGEGGVLTEAVRRRPYSVVLLDEVEKAHPDVHEIFYQVFDKGVMEDGEGRAIDFKNTLIILTTNVGTDLLMSLCKDPELLPDAAATAQALRQPLLKTFPPALLGRMVTIPYYPLGDVVMARIIRLQLERVEQRIRRVHAARFTYDESVPKLIAARCTEPESGGRMIDAIVTNTLLAAMSRELLSRIARGEPTRSIAVSTAGPEFTYVFE